MRPITTPDTTDRVVGPEGSGIEPLPVEVLHHSLSVSTWELTDEEREMVAAGGRVALTVPLPQGAVALQLAAPYCENCNKPMTWRPALKIFTCEEPDEG